MQNNTKAAKVAANAIQSPSLLSNFSSVATDAPKLSHTYTSGELWGNEDFLAFAASAPRLQKMAEIELRWAWDEARKNARIAANLETRADEIKAALDILAEQSLTLGDLRALQLLERGQPAFGWGVPDYVLPAGHKRADWE